MITKEVKQGLFRWVVPLVFVFIVIVTCVIVASECFEKEIKVVFFTVAIN